MQEAFKRPLIVFEMANNHMGSLEHGLRMLKVFGEVVAPYRSCFDFAFKLQYRHLDTFIHPDFQKRMDIKYVKRFQETRLSDEDFIALRKEMDAQGFIPVCTAFDEVSVDKVEAHEFQFLKIASCSFGDWPLMERMARSGLPIIASTAGVSLDVLDQVVSFFDHRQRPLTLLHCIGEYPTPAAHLQLNQIDFLKNRYPNHRVGFSTHESPDNTHFVQMALAKGASVFEKHVGLPTPESPLNAYSASPDQVKAWLDAAQEALICCGTLAERYEPDPLEVASLHELRRGVYVKAAARAGDLLDEQKVFFALPTQSGQLTANEFSKYSEFMLQRDLDGKAAVMIEDVESTHHRAKVINIVKRVRALLQKGHAVVSEKADVEISHHYGLDRFEEIGTTIINVVNRAYCKKLIVMLPGQRHPEQYHQQKEETFHLLYGELVMQLDGVEERLQAGDVLTVERGVKHAFWSQNGAIIEEISSTHFVNDSFYTDAAINQNPNRKTQLTYFFG